MNFLAIDTATEACTIALQLDGHRYENVLPQRQHAERILEQVNSVLSDAGCTLGQMDAMIWGRGPGMFTGLRIGAGVVQGLAYAAGLPVVCVSTLAVLAQARPEPYVLAAIDARMGQVYWAAYRKDAEGTQPLGEERVADPGSILLDSDGPFVGTGSGWDQYSVELERALGPKAGGWARDQFPAGDALLDLGMAGFSAGRAVAAMDALPVYVRDSVAKKQVSI